MLGLLNVSKVIVLMGKEPLLGPMGQFIFKRYKYPPDEEKKAIDLVLVQAEQFSEEWAVN